MPQLGLYSVGSTTVSAISVVKSSRSYAAAAGAPAPVDVRFAHPQFCSNRCVTALTLFANHDALPQAENRAASLRLQLRSKPVQNAFKYSQRPLAFKGLLRVLQIGWFSPKARFGFVLNRGKAGVAPASLKAHLPIVCVDGEMIEGAQEKRPEPATGRLHTLEVLSMILAKKPWTRSSASGALFPRRRA